MSELTSKDLHWFKLANSNPPTGFYAFKDRFLRRFGTPEGFDLQHMPRICYGCEGSGEYLKGVECNRCDGSGIYDIRDHWLQRWNVCGTIFHKPMDHAEVYHLHVYKYPDPVQEFTGKIKHADVCGRSARRAYYRLLLRWEPANFYWEAVRQIKERCYWARKRLVWKLIALRDKLDLFPAVENDGVPF